MSAYAEYRRAYEANWAPRGFHRFERSARWNQLNDSINAVREEVPLPPGNGQAEASLDPAEAQAAQEIRRRFIESLEARGVEPEHAEEIYRVELAKTGYDAARTIAAADRFKEAVAGIRRDMTGRHGEPRGWTNEAREEYRAFIAQTRCDLFHNFIVREASTLQEARIAEMPPREKSVYRKAMDTWTARPRWQRVIISSAAITLGVAALSPVGLGLGAAATMFSGRVVRGMLTMGYAQAAAGAVGAASEMIYFRGARQGRAAEVAGRARNFNLREVSLADELHRRHEDAEAADKRRKAILKGLAAMAVAGYGAYDGMEHAKAMSGGAADTGTGSGTPEGEGTATGADTTEPTETPPTEEPSTETEPATPPHYPNQTPESPGAKIPRPRWGPYPENIVEGGAPPVPPEVPRSSSGPFPPGMEPPRGGDAPLNEVPRSNQGPFPPGMEPDHDGKVPPGGFEQRMEGASFDEPVNNGAGPGLQFASRVEFAGDGHGSTVSATEANLEATFDKELATIRKGEGVWHAVRRQLMAQVEHDPARFRLSPEDLEDANRVREAVNRETQRILTEEKMIGSDGSEVRVAHPGAVVGLAGDRIVISEGDTYRWEPGAKAEPLAAEVENDVQIADGQPSLPTEAAGIDPVDQSFNPKDGRYVEYLNKEGTLRGALENQMRSHLGEYFGSLPSANRSEVIGFLNHYIEAHPSLIGQKLGGELFDPGSEVNFSGVFENRALLREAIAFPEEARMLRTLGFSPEDYLNYDYVNILRNIRVEEYLRHFDPRITGITGSSVGETEYFIHSGRAATVEINEAHLGLAELIRNLARTHDVNGMSLGDFVRNYGSLRSQ